MMGDHPRDFVPSDQRYSTCLACGWSILKPVRAEDMQDYKDALHNHRCFERTGTMSEGQKPSVGRIVHFYTMRSWPMGAAGRANAAIVTNVNDDGTLNLGVWVRDGGHFAVENVPLRAGTEPLQTFWWEWPPRV